MMVRKPPAFQFYASDFFSGVADMTDAEVGIYIRLLCLSWDKGGLSERQHPIGHARRRRAVGANDPGVEVSTRR